VQTKSLNGLTVAAASPRENHHARDLGCGADVDHPDRSLDVEVVEDDTRVQPRVRTGVTVDGARRVSVKPTLTSHVSLHLTTVVNPRLLAVCHILHCKSISQSILYWTHRC